MTLSRFFLPFAALALLSGPAFAQTAAPSATAAKPMAPATVPAAKPATPTTSGRPATVTADAKAAKSKACSAEADKQNLHGKARKKFRDDCKRH